MSDAASDSREVESANDRYAVEHPHGDWHVASAATVDPVAEKMSLHFASNPYLTFQDMTPEGRLTRIVEVIAVRDGALLGLIRWFGPWRQYVFAPEPECVFNIGCLKTIEQNVGVLNAIQKGRL